MESHKPRGRPPYPDILTPAEWKVAEAVRHGLTGPQIARRNGTSVDAVKYHVGNILQKLGLANRMELRNWNGIPADSPMFEQEKAMDDNLKISALGQISRNVSDLDAAIKWYRDRLGLPLLYSFGDVAFFDCDGVRLFLNQSQEPLPNDSILYFPVSDIRTAASTLKNRGITFINAPHKIHTHDDGSEEWMAFFEDVDGRPLALMATVRP
jgi:DNA-binding CsgD family transcriptional regulator/catechol 2,3-dioxygenase-like lactoylglutathione lyase family enzyme